MNNGKEPIFISAVIYVRNNAATIGSFLQHVYGQLEKQFAQFEIICVDDASTDLSEQKIREAAKDFTCPVTIVNMGFVQGVELAMNAGCDIAIVDFVYEFNYAQQT